MNKNELKPGLNGQNDSAQNNIGLGFESESSIDKEMLIKRCT